MLIAELSDDPQDLDDALLHRLPSVPLARRPLPRQLLELASLLLVPTSTAGEPLAPLGNQPRQPSRHVPSRSSSRNACVHADAGQDAGRKHPRAAALAGACFRLAAEALAGGTASAAPDAAAAPHAAVDVGFLAQVRGTA